MLTSSDLAQAWKSLSSPKSTTATSLASFWTSFQGLLGCWEALEQWPTLFLQEKRKAFQGLFAVAQSRTTDKAFSCRICSTCTSYILYIHYMLYRLYIHYIYYIY